MNMKIKQALGTTGLLFALAGCNLDIQMYDGVTAEDITARNIKELSQGHVPPAEERWRPDRQWLLLLGVWRR